MPSFRYHCEEQFKHPPASRRAVRNLILWDLSLRPRYAPVEKASNNGKSDSGVLSEE